MRKIIAVACLALFMSSTAQAADVTLQIVVPDAWVGRALAATNSVWPDKPANLTQKQWAEYNLRQYLKRVIVEYENRVKKEAALDAANYQDLTEAEALE